MQGLRLRLEPEKVLLIRGPASVRSESQGASVLGMSLAGRKVLVRINKVLPFECQEPVYFSILLGEGGETHLSEGRIGTKVWKGISERIARERPRKVLLLGENDSGKSTLSTHLANLAVQRSERVGLIDGDLGQSDLAPPGCMGSAIIDEPIADLRNVKAQHVIFIGSTSPYGLTEFIAQKLKALEVTLEKEEATFIVANTDGFVDGEGVGYKLRIVHELNPDLIVYLLGRAGEELHDKLLVEVGKGKIVSTERPENPLKDRDERVERRLSQYSRFLQSSRKLTISLLKLKIVFQGHKFAGKTVFTHLGLEKEGDEGSKINIGQGMEDIIGTGLHGKNIVFPSSSLGSLFVGLGINDKILGFGIIERVHPNAALTIKTPLLGEFDTLHLSTIRLLKGIREERRLEVINLPWLNP